jgi:hypothetical protein
MKTWKRFGWTYLVVVVVLFFVDWVLGVARLQWPGFKPVFVGVNFPFSLGFLWLEQQPNSWWQANFGQYAGDEAGQFIAFGWMILLQGVIYTLIIHSWRRWRATPE